MFEIGVVGSVWDGSSWKRTRRFSLFDVCDLAPPGVEPVICDVAPPGVEPVVCDVAPPGVEPVIRDVAPWELLLTGIMLLHEFELVFC